MAHDLKHSFTAQQKKIPGTEVPGIRYMPPYRMTFRMMRINRASS